MTSSVGKAINKRRRRYWPITASGAAKLSLAAPAPYRLLMPVLDVPQHRVERRAGRPLQSLRLAFRRRTVDQRNDADVVGQEVVRLDEQLLALGRVRLRVHLLHDRVVVLVAVAAVVAELPAVRLGCHLRTGKPI